MAASVMPNPLPTDAQNKMYVRVHTLLAGEFWAPDRVVFEDCVQDRVPDFTFMITYPTHGRTLFDLGLRKVNIMET